VVNRPRRSVCPFSTSAWGHSLAGWQSTRASRGPVWADKTAIPAPRFDGLTCVQFRMRRHSLQPDWKVVTCNMLALVIRARHRIVPGSQVWLITEMVDRDGKPLEPRRQDLLRSLRMAQPGRTAAELRLIVMGLLESWIPNTHGVHLPMTDRGMAPVVGYDLEVVTPQESACGCQSTPVIVRP
jgi:hypothetical protein